MVPGTAVLRCIEAVCEAVSRGDRTLSDSVHTIHMHGFVLSDAMPMNARPVPFHIVDHLDMNSITPASFDPRPRIGVVE